MKKRWGGKRKGAGRKKGDRPRRIVCYRLADEVVEQFWATCVLLRVPPAAMLEDILERWCREHEDDLIDGHKKLTADKAAFLRQPMRKANVAIIQTRDHMKPFLADLQKKAAATLNLALNSHPLFCRVKSLISGSIRSGWQNSTAPTAVHFIACSRASAAQQSKSN